MINERNEEDVKKLLKSFRRKFSEKEIWICDICDKIFISKAGYWKHEKSEHVR